jgi:hypothetical protein
VLWDINFNDAHALFLGYLLLKPQYDKLREKIKKENYQNKIYEHSEVQILERFTKSYEKDIEKVVSNKLTYDELNDLEKLDLKILLAGT